MARSFSNAKTVSSFVANEISSLLARRGYAAASQGTASVSSSIKTVAPSVMLKKKQGSEEKSWGPDPITGYYRPENQAKDIDAAELRDMLVNRPQN